jgi:hypothetical protein
MMLRRLEIRELDGRDRKGCEIGPRADEELSDPGGLHEGSLRNQTAQRGHSVAAAHREARGTARPVADEGSLSGPELLSRLRLTPILSSAQADLPGSIHTNSLERRFWGPGS